LVFSRKQLSKIIEIRALEIFREANKELKKISRHQSLPCGIVLTGGGSKLPKIKELAKREFKLNCRLGLPKGFSSSLDDPRLSTVAGLVLIGFDLEGENGSSEHDKGIKSKIKKLIKIFIP